MKTGGKVAALLLLSAGSLGAHRARAADDPYGPLKLYEGKWDYAATTGTKEVLRIENHCARTGLFFVCEQIVDAKTVGLVVYLPVAKMTGGGEEYKTIGLAGDKNPSGGWTRLTIEGEHWVYSWQDTDGSRKVFWRNVNQFSGSDKIRFEIQRSDDGNIWKTVKAGDEVRVRE